MEPNIKKRIPLREAYTFASANGLGEAVTKIREMEIEWDRSYTSTVRKGLLIRELEAKSLLPTFIAQLWPFGATTEGDNARRRCLRIADEYEAFLQDRGGDIGEPGDQSTTANSLEFALEAHLRDFLARNLDQIEPGLKLYQENGSKGVEFSVSGGRIDLLALDRLGKFVVIELKLSQGRNKALGQLLYYMGWVDQNLGNAPCRGIVVANDISDELVVAISRTPGVTLFRYKMSFSVEHVRSA